MKAYPALDIRAANLDRVYPALDDFSPTAIEERHGGLRAFFLTASDRDQAHAALAAQFHAFKLDVPDDDWARRSQEGLAPVTVGGITVFPRHPNHSSHLNPPNPPNPQSPIPNHHAIVISPSMGFGTGHHATTRLCLRALQSIDLAGKTVLDVGTGSGVLAIAASVLGAARATGIDFDPDAIQSARENLELNPSVSNVTFSVADLGSAALEPADVVTANLTGALLVRAAATLLEAATPGGVLILSGLVTAERDDVVRAFRHGSMIGESAEDEWIGLNVKKS